MRYSKAFIQTTKEDKDLIIKAGLAHQVAAGHFDLTVLGTKVISKIERIIREEMEAIGAQEVRIPVLQPGDFWKETGRWEVYGEEMFRLKSRSGREFCLAPTHEELMVELVKSRPNTYKNLPITLYQFGPKFRDEKRPRGGLLRAREFQMKDGYSFDVDMESMNQSYAKMRAAYNKIFHRLGIDTLAISANSGEVGGSFSEEYMAPSENGEDKFVMEDGTPKQYNEGAELTKDQSLKMAIEVGHIFQLGTRYSDPMKLTYTASDGKQKPIMMGCYGIGVSRLIPTIVDQNHDKSGIIWPEAVTPFDLSLTPIHYESPEIKEETERLYDRLRKHGVDVLLDDRGLAPGVMIKDSELIGIPYKMTIGPQGLANGTVDIEYRKDRRKDTIGIADAIEYYLTRNGTKAY